MTNSTSNTFDIDISDNIDADSFRISKKIECFGKNIPDPFYTFIQHKWPSKIFSRLKQMRMFSPTPIQAQTLPIALQGRDLIGVARSGSGKTLCFVLPALVCALNTGLNHWPTCLVLTPTRELTHQVERTVKAFRFVRSVCLYGGVSRDVQMMFLRDGRPHIVIATPGRLCDQIDRAVTHLKHIKYLVIDEADKMLEMGQERHFKRIMEIMPTERQTLMFSATWPNSVKELAEEYLKDYCQVIVGGGSESSYTVNPNIKQIIDVCDGFNKPDKLIQHLEKYAPTISGFNKTMIFVRSKDMADGIVKLLRKNDIFCRALHRDKSQEEINFVIRHFQKGTIPVVVCTDLASRGLDFKNVTLVINYDFPKTIEDYIHRIGRTARHDSKGMSISLFTMQDNQLCHDLIKVLNDAGQEINQDLIDMSKEDIFKVSDENDDENMIIN